MSQFQLPFDYINTSNVNNENNESDLDFSFNSGEIGDFVTNLLDDDDDVDVNKLNNFNENELSYHEIIEPIYNNIESEIIDDYYNEDELDQVDWVLLANELEYILLNRDPQYLYPHPMAQALAVGGYSVEALFEALSYTGGDIYSAASIIEGSEVACALCKPCRHMLIGQCFRSDCTFDHELSHITCRHWLLATGCASFKDGTYCPFLHNLTNNYNVEEDVLNNGENKDNELLLDETFFPSLGSSSKKKDNLSNNNINIIYNTESNNVPIIDNEFFPTLKEAAKIHPKEKISTNASISSIKMSSWYSDAVKLEPTTHLNNNQLNLNNNYNSHHSYQYDNINEGVHDIVNESFTSEVVSFINNNYNKFIDVSISNKIYISDWVSSGIKISEEYKALRSEARDLAISRNICLQESTNAFLANKKDVARNLSQQGQEINEKMKMCHLKAAKSIFNKR